MQTNMIRLTLSDSWSQSTCTQTREKNKNTNKCWRYDISSLWLLKSDHKSTCTQTRERRTNVRTNVSKYWEFAQILKICINIEFLIQKPKKILNTHLPQAKILLWWIKPFMPKVGFWATQRKNPTKLWNYRQLKTLRNVVQKFDKILAKIYYKPTYRIPIKVLPWT